MDKESQVPKRINARRLAKRVISRVMPVLCFAAGLEALAAADTLGAALQANDVPTAGFTAPELVQKITSWASSHEGDAFLMAYYVDDGSGLLHAPLHVVRHGRGDHSLRRADLQEATAPFMGGTPMGCFGSAMSIEEYFGVVYIATHLTPSAGCVLLLTPQLSFRIALSGFLLGTVGADYAILHKSQVHFAMTHPTRIAVYNLKRNRQTRVYPPERDPLRQQFSRALRAHMPSEKWCRENNAPCDPDEFDDTLLGGRVPVNAQAKVFGFEMRFKPTGFGDQAQREVKSQVVAYVYRLRGGVWGHRQFSPARLKPLFGVDSVEELVREKPDAPFALAPGRP